MACLPPLAWIWRTFRNFGNRHPQPQERQLEISGPYNPERIPIPVHIQEAIDALKEELAARQAAEKQE